MCVCVYVCVCVCMCMCLCVYIFGHKDQTGVITSPTESIRSPTAKRPVDESLKEMILTRDSGMLIGPVRPFQVISGPRTE